jgi:probable selenium-dependent hydroxylase accessory protein YqeC
MQTIFFQQNDSLVQAFGVTRGVTAFVGGGGKTTLMLRLAAELSGAGSRVIVTTTTHIFPPDGMDTLTNAREADVRAALAKENAVCVGTPSKQGKLSAPELPVRVLATLADYVLVEADGARKLPLKAPAEHEPVVPEETRLVIAVAGLDGVGKILEETAFRPELFAALTGGKTDGAVSEEDVARVLSHPDGLRKQVNGGMRFCVLLNKADDAKRRSSALKIAKHLQQAGNVERTVIAALGEAGGHTIS